MNNDINIKFIQETYERMSDDDLVRVATQDAYGLTPEAIEVVKAEIQKRGLDDNFLKGVDAQNKTYSLEEVDIYCRIVSNLSCPSCGTRTERLNGTMISEVMSFLLFTNYKKKIIVSCPHCLDKVNDDALLKTALLGWWGIPWGLIRTPQAIRTNLKSKRTNHQQESNNYLRSFTLSVIGELETYKDDKEKLLEIVAKRNGL